MLNSPYISIARPDHWFKNIFMIPGIALGILIDDIAISPLTTINIVVAIVATCLAASANYTINEWLDAEFDRHHPIKKNRPSACGLVSARGVYLQWALLSIAALILGYRVNLSFYIFIAILLFMGAIYNIEPLRTKDRAHFDILTESINNPIRFMLGWLAVNTTHYPPSSILVVYWMGGAYLMTIKRYSEYRYIGDPQLAGLYRKSFQYYTEHKLLLSAFFYSLTAAFFTGIFLIKYRIEYILTIPFLALLFVWYLQIGMNEDSAAQRPEKLYREKGLVVLVSFTFLLFLLLTLVDIPVLSVLLETHVR